MYAHSRRVLKIQSESSFEITLEETLKALHERRLEINSLLRSLEAEKRQRLGGSTGRSTRRNSKTSEPQPCMRTKT